jgi:hypothetical protein
MNNEFVQLRAKAREKRDRAIAMAADDYTATLSQIATLERQLLYGWSVRRASIRDCVEAVMPRDQPFTLPEIIAALEGRYPARIWRRHSVGYWITKHVNSGLVRRLMRHKNSESTVYVRASSNVPIAPFEDVTLSQAIRSILTKPLNETEITVRLREQEFPTEQTNGTFRACVLAELRKGFRRDKSGKWHVR